MKNQYTYLFSMYRLLFVAMLGMTAACEAQPKPVTGLKPSYQSAGLGLKRSEWEAMHGQPVEQGGTTDVWVYETNGHKLYVTFWDNVVRDVESNYTPAVSLDTARKDAAIYLPSDAKLTEHYPFQYRDINGVVDLYFSPSLSAQLFPTRGHRSDIWAGAQPGTISVVHRFQSGDVVATVSVEAGKQFASRGARTNGDVAATESAPTSGCVHAGGQCAGGWINE